MSEREQLFLSPRHDFTFPKPGETIQVDGWATVTVSGDRRLLTIKCKHCGEEGHAIDYLVDLAGLGPMLPQVLHESWCKRLKLLKKAAASSKPFLP